MFFCPNCKNLLDITRNVKPVENLTETNSEMSITSEFEEPQTNMTGGKSDDDIIQDIIVKAQNDTLTLDDLVSVINENDMDKIKKHPEFKKIDDKQKETIFNKIINILTSKQNNVVDTSHAVKIFYICKTCGYDEQIKEGTLIFSRSSDTSYHDNIYYNYEDLIYDQTLPNTRNYNCPNKECKSHTDFSLKEAVFKRFNGYNLRYVCKACKTSWLNS